MDPQASTRDSTRRFSNRAEFYVRARPKYPPELLQFCQRDLGLKSDHRIADIGSGTGFLSELFVHNGNPVFAVEPNAEMRLSAEDFLRGYQNFHSRIGTAEATGLADRSVEFVVAGQAFHWFNPPRARAEFKRILVPGGWVILVWNKMREGDGSFAAEYRRVTRQFSIEVRPAHHKVTEPGSTIIAEFFAPAQHREAVFSASQWLDLDGVCNRATSESTLPAPGHPRHGEMLSRLRELFGRFATDGRVCMQYDTRTYYGQLP